MNYTTFNKNNFYIKKDSTLPEIKYPLLQQIREKYNISDNMLENVAVTFSMINAETGLYCIANVPANIKIIKDAAEHPSEEKYTLTYKFKQRETSKAGRYEAEFVLDSINNDYGCGKIKFPIDGYINVIISDSITKTSVV